MFVMNTFDTGMHTALLFPVLHSHCGMSWHTL